MRRWWWMVMALAALGCGKGEEKQDITAAPEPAAEANKAEAAKPVDPDAPAQPGLLKSVPMQPERLQGVRLVYKPAEARNYAVDFIQEGTQSGVGGRVIRRGVRQQMLINRTTTATQGPEWKETMKFLQMEITPTEISDSAEEAEKKRQAEQKKAAGQPPDAPKKSGAEGGMQGLMDRMATTLQSTQFTLDVTERQGIKAVSVLAAKNDAPNPMAEAIRDMLKDATVSFPDRALQPGESWDDVTEEKQDRAASRVLTKRTYHWTLVGWLPPTAECPACVALKGDGNLERAGDLDIPGVKGTMAGRSAIRVEAVFNTESGQLEQLVMTATDSQTHHAVNAGQQVELTERMRIRLTMERKPLEQGPPATPKKETP